MKGFARVCSAQPTLLSADIVSVETDLSRGLYSFSMVGLPDKAVEESRDRVSAAIKHSGFDSPKSQNHKVTVSLAPAELKKEGAYFDLPIAVSYLLAAGAVSFQPEKKLFAGELALDGSVRPIKGVLSIARKALEIGIEEMYVPKQNAREAALIKGISIIAVDTFKELVEHLNERTPPVLQPEPPTPFIPETTVSIVDFSDVRGQETAKRALEIAAAGRHNIVLYGPPGTGKTLLASALPGILPPLTFEEALEATAIHSVTGLLSNELISNPPFRSPHHTASYVALVGGGATPRPGEVTLAHHGVLFLDEFVEFERRAIDALREPLENRTVTVSRAKGSITFPANFILVAALNPTRGHSPEETFQSEKDRLALQKKISGPIADRIDLWIEVPHIAHEKLAATSVGNETSQKIQKRVVEARAHQTARFKNAGKTNSMMGVREIEKLVPLSPSVQELLNDAAKKLQLSPRAFHRTIKIARTIADLAHERFVGEAHVLEALQYRPKNLF